MSKEWDRQNSGTLFKNDKQGKASRPDYSGSINVDGRDYWLSAWIKDGAKGKFMSLAVKPKDAAAEGHPDRFRDKPTRTHNGRPVPDIESDIPF